MQELIKHTPEGHPDHGPLIEAQREIHRLALKIDRAEKEMLQQEQLRDIESLIEGHIELQHPQRDFIRYDLVTISASTTLSVAKKERVLFLFCDLLIMTSIKKKVSRRSNLLAAFSNSFNDLSLLEGNKFKLLLKVSLDQVDVKQDHKIVGQIHDINQRKLISNQRQHNVQQAMLLNNTKRELESDLLILQQIELLSNRLSLLDRTELLSTVNGLSNQVHLNLRNLELQQHSIATDSSIMNFQESHLMQPKNMIGATEPFSQHQEKTGSLQDHHDRDKHSSTVATVSNSSNANSSNEHNEHSTSLEFTIVNFHATKNNSATSGGSLGSMNHNLYSSSISSEHSNDQSHQAANGQSSELVNGQNASSVHEILVVTFMSPERRQAFLQAFNDAKFNRLKQQRNQQYQRMFSSSLTLRLSSQEQSPLKSHSSIDNDSRRARLHHQDEVDLRHLESLTASIRNNHLVNGPSGVSVRNVSAPQNSGGSGTLVHQMSAPQALAPMGAELSLSTRSGAVGTIRHCNTCSSSCLLDSSNQDYHDHQAHQNHHHHQLMNQASSQAPMLSMICCHDHHNDTKSVNTDLAESNSIDEYTECRINTDKLSTPVCERIRGNVAHQPKGSPCLPTVPLDFSPRFKLTIPMDFLATQHPALQFTCSASKMRKTDTDWSKLLPEGHSKTRALCDDLGQLWLCMSNGYVSHVALISFRKEKVLTGSRALLGDHQRDQATNAASLEFDFQCYDVIPVVQSGGDICKSQINCAAHVGWSDRRMKRWKRIESERIGTNSDETNPATVRLPEVGESRVQEESENSHEPMVRVAIKNASPPIDIKVPLETKDTKHEGLGLSESAPSPTSLKDEEIVARLSSINISSLSSAQLNSTKSSSANRSGKVPQSRALQSPGFHKKTFVGRRQQSHHSSHVCSRSLSHDKHQRSGSPSNSQTVYRYNDHRIAQIPVTNGRCGALIAAGDNQIRLLQQHNHHHHHHHHHHSHSHHHHLQPRQHHNHQHHQRSHQAHQNNYNQHQSGNTYSSKHHTVPLAELRRALQRRNRAVVSDSEGTQSTINVLETPINYNQLALPPNDALAGLERASFDHSGIAERRLSRPARIEFASSRPMVKKSRSTTPPARYATVDNQKNFRSARMLRHQASLKTSSILAKLVSGATKSSSYLRRKNSTSKRANSSEKHSDVDDNDTDTDNSARVSRLMKQDDSLSMESANSPIYSGLNGLTIAMSANPQQMIKQQQKYQNNSNPNINNPIVSPLSSASSINTTNSSLTVNSACGSSHGHGSCTMLHHHPYNGHSMWSSTTCCFFDPKDRDRIQNPSGDVVQPLECSKSPVHGTLRSRSATVPCRALCHYNSYDHPDSYLITKCSNQADLEDGLKKLRDELLAGRIPAEPSNESYKVSEIIKETTDSSLPREIYRRGNSEHMMNGTSKYSSNDNSDIDEMDNSSLWLGCEDGSLVVMDCLSADQRDSFNVGLDITRETKDCGNVHCEYRLTAPICDIKNYQDMTVFVALSNGTLVTFSHHQSDGPESEAEKTPGDGDHRISRSLPNPKIINLSESNLNLTSRLCVVEAKNQLWYSYGRSIFVVNMETFEIMATIRAPTNDTSIQFSMQSLCIDHLELTECLEGVWVSFKSSPLIQFYSCNTFKMVLEMSLLEPISKVLSYGNEIIRQHKTACLGVTCLLSVGGTSGNLDDHDSDKSTSLFIGTTAGIIIYLSLSHEELKRQIEKEKSVWIPQVISLRHGHSGQVKFLRLIEMDSDPAVDSTESKDDMRAGEATRKQLCLVSAGAGIDLYGPNTEQQIAQHLSGDEDCLNHMILWQL